MCDTCGCDADVVTVTHLGSGHPVHVGADGAVIAAHDHDPAHDNDPAHPPPHPSRLAPPSASVTLEPLGIKVLAKNDAAAADNRRWIAERGVAWVNVMSSPGAGKTTLLSAVLPRLMSRGPVAVIEGDQATTLDAERIQRVGAPVVQVNTGKGCHLEAGMVRRGLEQLAPPAGALAIVENVGNLVCPALFDLGEGARVVERLDARRAEARARS